MNFSYIVTCIYFFELNIIYFDICIGNIKNREFKYFFREIYT